MNLSDHLRPLLREHDCVIIPDFGGLVAEYAPARVQLAGRHLLSPPTRHVAFNQSLTRNDGLLLDALRQHLGLSAAEAREQLRQAVATLHQELQAQQRLELPGVGIFRQLAGRGLQFEYTGTENLFAAAYGLPELTAHPIAVIDARLAREQQAQLVPRLRSAATRNNRVPLGRLVRGGAIGLAAGVVAGAIYLLSLHPAAVPVAWQGYLPRWEQARTAPVPQQATLATAPLATLNTPAAAAEETASEAKEEKVEMPTVVLKTVPVSVPVASAPPAPAPVAAAPKVVTAAKPVAKPVVSIKDSKAVTVAPAAPKATVTVASPAKAATAAASATTIKAHTGRFYVMVAAYSSWNRAEEGRRNLAHAGRPAKIIAPYPGTRYYRLTAADFADRPTALAAAARLRQNPHLDKGLSVIAY
ncbi:SPOR domain-containing protein [Hymenobacter bucti]|uniref:SPOR domain-containing protein n=1 Tax=Hymenobacter bucti TaxID=1844114 RepID=A0ABW4QTH7_9BACT